MYVYATPETFKANRNTKRGSLFIQTLVDVMKKKLYSCHLEEVLLFVKNHMAKKTATLKERKVKQIVSVVSQTRGKINFTKP